jgi:hypothetical protein
MSSQQRAKGVALYRWIDWFSFWSAEFHSSPGSHAHGSSRWLLIEVLMAFRFEKTQYHDCVLNNWDIERIVIVSKAVGLGYSKSLKDYQRFGFCKTDFAG